MSRIGGLLVFLGFGSAILHFTDYQLVLVSWSEGMQPVFGIVVGLVGVALIALPALLQRRKTAATPPPVPAPQPQNPQG